MLRGVNQLLNKGVFIIVLFVMLPFGSYNWAQSTASTPEEENVININELENDGIREELQRYFGYEDLLFRYLTLPYDINQNVNQTGRHVDNGYIYLALLPLMLLVLLYKRKRWFYACMILSILYLFICFSFSRLGKANGRFITISDENWSEFIANGEKGVGGEFLALSYDIGSMIASPIVSILGSLTGSTDHISYPVLFTIFIVLLWLVSSGKLISKSYSQTVGVITVSFFMLWWLLSSGIIWYGFLMYPLLLSLLLRGIKRSKIYLSEAVLPVFRTIAMAALIIWTCMAFVSRISNVDQINVDAKNSGEGIASTMLMLYSAGLITADECREISAPNVAKAIEALNSDNRLIMRVGTHLEFEIRDNHLRVMEDNTLGLLFEYYKQHRDKIEFIAHLKSLGYGYIVLDLNTPLLDRTPEQSLKKKYQLILSHIYQNPKIRLVTTDREVVFTNSNGVRSQAFRVIGEEYLNYGSYAVYEIL